MEDKQIVDLFLERSEQAISELANKYEALCHKVACNIVKNKMDAEECVNDAYLGVWNSIPPHTPNPLGTYVCRIVRNLSIKKYHSNSAKKRNSYYDLALEELEGCIPSPDSILKELDSKELAKVIDAFLDTLDQKNRILFVRRYWFSQPIGELAELFGMTEHNVSVRLYRTRTKMRKYLVKEGVAI